MMDSVWVFPDMADSGLGISGLEFGYTRTRRTRVWVYPDDKSGSNRYR